MSKDSKKGGNEPTEADKKLAKRMAEEQRKAGSMEEVEKKLNEGESLGKGEKSQNDDAQKK